MKISLFAISMMFCFTSFGQNTNRKLHKIYQDGHLITSYDYYQDGRVNHVLRYDTCGHVCNKQEIYKYHLSGELKNIEVYQGRTIRESPNKLIEFEFDKNQQLMTQSEYQFNLDQNEMQLISNVDFFYDGNDYFPNVEIKYDREGQILEEIYYYKNQDSIFNTYEIYPKEGDPKKYSVEYYSNVKLHHGNLPWYIRDFICKKCELPISKITEIDFDNGQIIKTEVEYVIEFNEDGYPQTIISKISDRKDIVFKFEYE